MKDKVTPEIRTAFFNAEGWYASDEVVLEWQKSNERQHPLSKEYKKSILDKDIKNEK